MTDTEELVSHFPMKDGEGSQIYNTQRDVSSRFDLRNRVLTVVCIDETRLQSRSLAVIEFLGPVPTTAGGFTTGWLVGLLVGSMVSCILARSKILKERVHALSLSSSSVFERGSMMIRYCTYFRPRFSDTVCVF